MPPSLELPPIEDLDGLITALPDRQRNVLGWLAHGKSNPEMAQIFGTSLKTIENECTQIFQALGVENRLAAAAQYLWWKMHQEQK